MVTSWSDVNAMLKEGGAPSASNDAVQQQRFDGIKAAIASGALTPRDAVASIVQGLYARPDREAVIASVEVQLAKLAGLTQFGTHVEDKVFGNGQGVDITPYSRVGSGTTIMPSYMDDSGEVHLLLGRKYKNPKNPAEGLSDQFILIGGYMDPHGLPGDGKVSYDHSLADCAAREMKEESNLLLPSGVRPENIGVRSQYGVTNDGRLHTVVGDYLVDYGKRNTPPQAQAGDDVAQVVWVKASDITRLPDVPPQPFGSKESRFQVTVEGKSYTIRDDHGPAIEAGVARMREKALNHELGVGTTSNDNQPSVLGVEATRSFQQRIQAERQTSPAVSDTEKWVDRPGIARQADVAKADRGIG